LIKSDCDGNDLQWALEKEDAFKSAKAKFCILLLVFRRISVVIDVDLLSTRIDHLYVSFDKLLDIDNDIELARNSVAYRRLCCLIAKQKNSCLESIDCEFTSKARRQSWTIQLIRNYAMNQS
jgi:hypothetical protein